MHSDRAVQSSSTTAWHSMLVVAVLSLAYGCESKAAIGAARTVLRLTNNSSLSQSLAAEYGRVSADVEVRTVEGNIETIERGAADFGFALAAPASVITR